MVKSFSLSIILTLALLPVAETANSSPKFVLQLPWYLWEVTALKGASSVNLHLHPGRTI